MLGNLLRLFKERAYSKKVRLRVINAKQVLQQPGHQCYQAWPDPASTAWRIRSHRDELLFGLDSEETCTFHKLHLLKAAEGHCRLTSIPNNYFSKVIRSSGPRNLAPTYACSQTLWSVNKGQGEKTGGGDKEDQLLQSPPGLRLPGTVVLQGSVGRVL